MSSTGQLQVAPIEDSVDNADEWQEVAAQISSLAGAPTQITLEIVAGMISGAVPLLFAADAAKDVNPLRGTFSGEVIAQCERYPGVLEGATPTSALIRLIGVHAQEGHPELRVHLAIQVKGADGTESVSSQFWDLQVGGEVIVGQSTCPNCGAPLSDGVLICEHCGADVRGVAKVPLVVNRLELY